VQFIPIAVFVLGLPILIRAFLAFDALVAIERSRYPAAWESDGRPRPILRGMFRSKFSLGGWLATQRCTFRWLFHTPSWASADPRARASLAQLRTSAALWNLVIVPVFAVTALLFSQVAP
jgi:hypothetical protein